MVKKSPISDKAIAGYKYAESLTSRDFSGCGKLPQNKYSDKKNAQFREEAGRFLSVAAN
jgi:hypothetical protein